MDWVWFLFRFEGRINRGKYWLATLIILGWMILALSLLAGVSAAFGIGGHGFAIDLFGISASINLNDDASTASWFPWLVIMPMTAAFAWCYAAASIKRLHDRNRSGWWMVPLIVAPGLFDHFEELVAHSYAVAVLGLAMFVLYIWGLVELYWLRGTRGPNRFGPDPLAPVDTRPPWDQMSEIEFVPHKASPPRV
jgi:uncharacterized membrane protein YhaH (DUF805 family)